MEELLRTNDPVVISALTSLFKQDDIAFFVADTHMSALEGSIGILPRRLLIEKDKMIQAKRLTKDAGFGEWLDESKK